MYHYPILITFLLLFLVLPLPSSVFFSGDQTSYPIILGQFKPEAGEVKFTGIVTNSSHLIGASTWTINVLSVISGPPLPSPILVGTIPYPTCSNNIQGGGDR